MKKQTIVLCALAGSALFSSVALAQAPLDTRFTYQGELSFLGEPVNDTADFEFRLYDDAVAGSEVGSVNVVANVLVVDGIFTVKLDFSHVFGETALFLEVAVRSPHDPTDTAPFTALLPRQPVTAAPVALALRHLRTEVTTGAPNVIGGDASNDTHASVTAATIVGGENHLITNNQATIGGGSGNLVSALQGTIAGGFDNSVQAPGGFVGGGESNQANGRYSVISGGLQNFVSSLADGNPHAPATIAGGAQNRIFDASTSISGGVNNSIGLDDADPFDSDGSSIGGGINNYARGKQSTIAGGLANESYDGHAAIGGGWGNIAGSDDMDPASAQYATVSGGRDNVAGGLFASIGGGNLNQANADYATIAGGGPSDPIGDPFGTHNQIFDDYGTIAGGGDNKIGSMSDGDPLNTAFATISGGRQHTIHDEGGHGTISGGFFHDVFASYSTVGGGQANCAGGDFNDGINFLIGGDHATVGGGHRNIAFGESSSIAGGFLNRVTGAFGAIGGGGPSDPIGDPLGTNNRVFDDYGTIGGGGRNRAGSDDADASTARFATVAGGSNNSAAGLNSAIGGGGSNVALGNFATVGGGSANDAGGFESTIAGGFNNSASGVAGFVGGGESNSAADSHGAVCGGEDNQVNAQHGFIGGGGPALTIGGPVPGNRVDGNYGAVVGGTDNRVLALYGFIGGGGPNPLSSIAGNRVTGPFGSVVGGCGNSAGEGAFVGGGIRNSATGQNSTIPGGNENVATAHDSFACGFRARALHNRTFVWNGFSGLSLDTFDSTAAGQFLIRSDGGVGINTNAPDTTLHVVGGTDVGLGGGGFLQLGDTGDANLALDPNEIMARNNGAAAALFVNPSGGNVFMGNNSAGATRVSINTNATTEILTVGGNICATGTIGVCSDSRFKTNVAPIQGALDLIHGLRGIRFDWRRDAHPDRNFAESRQIGFIAQEAEKIAPEVVCKGADGYYSVDYGRLTPILVEAVKEQQNHIETQESVIAEQKAQIESLSKRLARLERFVGEQTKSNGGAR
ncbi:MAG: tail fiber domain-containing protein [Phycisphaerales bacterium]|nr:tail fiber domain-containing protein [Phycisphaerales bacterium]